MISAIFFYFPTSTLFFIYLFILYPLHMPFWVLSNSFYSLALSLWYSSYFFLYLYVYCLINYKWHTQGFFSFFMKIWHPTFLWFSSCPPRCPGLLLWGAGTSVDGSLSSGKAFLSGAGEGFRFPRTSPGRTNWMECPIQSERSTHC